MSFKFRAWHEPSKQYFKWDDISINGRNNCVIHITEGVFETSGTPNSVILEQYTEMPDKNDKEICQNDKVKYCDYICVVDRKYGSFVLDIIEGDKRGFFYFSDMASKYLEIIGTIHDQPELFQK